MTAIPQTMLEQHGIEQIQFPFTEFDVRIVYHDEAVGRRSRGGRECPREIVGE